jgi:hypothetical protein
MSLLTPALTPVQIEPPYWEWFTGSAQFSSTFPFSAWGEMQLAPAWTWLLKGVQALLKVASLPANWDERGSPSIRPAALHKASQLLAWLAASAARGLLCSPELLPVPYVIPVSGGGLQLEWQVGSRELEIEFLPDGSALFLRVAGEQLEEGMFPSDPDVPQVQELFCWLLGSQKPIT